MSIIAILSGLSLSAMYRSRDQVFIRHAAERLKSDIRGQFINAISIKKIDGAGSDCLDKMPKMRTIRIDLAQTEFNSYQIVDYCEGSAVATLGSTPKVVKTVDISGDLGFRKPASITLDDPSLQIVSTPPGTGYLHIVFTTPYGKFYAVKSPNPYLIPAWFAYNETTDSFSATAGSGLIRTTSFQISLAIMGGTNPQQSNFSLTKDGNIEE